MESQIHEIQMMAERRKQKEAQEMARIRAKQEHDRKLLRLVQEYGVYASLTVSLSNHVIQCPRVLSPPAGLITFANFLHSQ